MQKYEGRLKEDWSFTDKVHEAAKEIVYKNIKSIEKASRKDDQEKGIDYWTVMLNGKKHAIQERFRTKNKFTVNSQEFTIRYKRPNSNKNQEFSELFKIEADLLLYGITNNTSTKDNSEISFKRIIVIGISELLRAINDKKILIDENENNYKNKPYIKGDKIYAIVKSNHEDTKGNSQLLIFDATHIKKLEKEGYNIIKKETGYIKNYRKEKFNNITCNI